MKTLRLLLTQVIDYAGMYPPASLPLAESIATYYRHRSAAESWLAKRIVLPVSALAGIDSKMLLNQDEFRFATIPKRVQEGWTKSLINDIAELKEFLRRHPNALADVLEVPLPAKWDTPEDLRQCLRSVSDALKDRDVFFEIPGGTGFIERFTQATKIIAEFPGWGVKLRSGGVTPDLFPAPAEIAKSMLLAREQSLPMKFTAGLHHPIRHWNDSVTTKMYGFINILMAGILGYVHQLSADQVELILQEENASHFVFSNEYAAWRDLKLPGKMIRELRQKIVSFGSCSIDEPVEDLSKLGWWEQLLP